jgi:hypothetical protein
MGPFKEVQGFERSFERLIRDNRLENLTYLAHHSFTTAHFEFQKDGYFLFPTVCTAI